MNNWSLEGKHRYYLDAVKIYHADVIDTLREKLIEDLFEMYCDDLRALDAYHIKRLTRQRVENFINKHFGVK